MRPMLSCLALVVGMLSVECAQAQRAGQGTYQPKILKRAGVPIDTSPFRRGLHYLCVRELSWFVNDEGNILRNRMVSGTVDLQLGNENYQVVLGTYALSGGNRIAPLFNRVILDNRAYTGGDLRITVFLKGIKKDTQVGSLLMNVASSTLGIAGGVAGTVTALGSSPILASAGRDLLTGVQNILNHGESPYGIFEEQGGLSFTIPRSQLVGRENFLLAYRGNDLTGTQLTVTDNGQGVYDVLADGKPLRGGAWILFHILRETVYGSDRPWSKQVENVRSELDDLMQDWRIGAKTRDQVMTALKPTLQGDTLGDRILAVRSEIRADQVMTEGEKTLETGRLITLLKMAQDACEVETGYEQYVREKQKLQEALLKGTEPPSAEAKATLVQESILVAKETQARSLRDFHEKFGFTPSMLEAKHYVSSEGDPNGPSDATYDKLPVKTRNQLAQAMKMLPSPELPDRELWQLLGEVERAKVARRSPERPRREDVPNGREDPGLRRK